MYLKLLVLTLASVQLHTYDLSDVCSCDRLVEHHQLNSEANQNLIFDFACVMI